MYRVSLKTCFFEKNVKNRILKNTNLFSISGIFMIITRRLVHISNKYSDYVSSYWRLKTNNFTPIFYFWIFWGFCTLFLFIYNFSLVHPCPNRQLGTLFKNKLNGTLLFFNILYRVPKKNENFDFFCLSKLYFVFYMLMIQ